MENENKEQRSAILTAALGTVESSLAICSSALSRPLEMIASQCWLRAIEQLNHPQKVTIIDIGSLTRSPIRGVIYWVPPEAPMAPKMPQEELQDAAIEQWLADHGTKTARICVDPIHVNLEPPLWVLGGSHAVIEQLDIDLMERFTSIAQAILESVPEGKQGKLMAVMPRMAFVTGDSPFVGKIHLDCRCCFHEHKPLVSRQTKSIWRPEPGGGLILT